MLEPALAEVLEAPVLQAVHVPAMTGSASFE
jgi:hypothetical protein